MFSLNDGRKELFQWDLDRVIIVSDGSIDEVHFANKTMSKSLSCKVYQEGERFLAKIPNILLQTHWDITAYGFDNNYTKHMKVFPVRKRPKPDEYIYTETDLYTVKDAVDEYLKELNINSGSSTNEELVVNADTHYDFPSVGNIKVIYKAYKEKLMYQWNETELKYEVLGSISDLSDINIIHGGDANGT